MATTTTTAFTGLINAAAPNLPLAPAHYSPQYFEQLNNVLRLYFNQLNTAAGVLRDNQNIVYANTQRDLTLLWLGAGEGIFSG
jgi:hypothetical protein